MSLFGKKCAWCGVKVGNPASVERMGKWFCSEDHASQYLQQTRAQSAAPENACC